MADIPIIQLANYWEISESSNRIQGSNMVREYKYFKNDYIDDIESNYFKPILNEIFVEYGKNIRVMGDVGCGNGIFTAYLKNSYDIKLYGFDGSEYALNRALENGFDEVVLNDDLSVKSLETKAEYFDFIINKDVLEHLMDPEFLLKEIARVLKTNGLFLLHVPNDFNLWKRIEFVFRNNVDTYKYFPDAKEWNRPHIRFFSFEGLKELLHLYGFEIVKSYSSYFVINLPIIQMFPGYSMLGKWLAGKFPTQFSQAFTVLTRKLHR